MEADPILEGEDARVEQWRVQRLEELGLTATEAEYYDNVDWHMLESLLKRGCDMGTALAILS